MSEEMNLQMFFPPTKNESKKEAPVQVEETPKFKYVKAFYTIQMYSMWKVPADWDDAKIGVKWDDIGYDGEWDKDTKSIKKVERRNVDDCFDFKYPDEGGDCEPNNIQSGLKIYTKEELEDDEGYETCEDE